LNPAGDDLAAPSLSPSENSVPMNPPVGPRLLVALDYPGLPAALALVDRLDPRLCRLKVGMELFTAAGPAVISALVERGFDVFLDMKFHDIPNTVAGAVRSAAELGVWMVNVHALGGSLMMRAAREALDGLPRRPLLIAVTVLTSMDRTDLDELGLDAEPQDTVLRLARMAQSACLDGVVCSAREATLLRRECGPDFRLVTPGVRAAGAADDDQRRIMTPTAALSGGADYLVVGRPITRAADPLAALVALRAEIGET